MCREVVTARIGRGVGVVVVLLGLQVVWVGCVLVEDVESCDAQRAAAERPATSGPWKFGFDPDRVRIGYDLVLERLPDNLWDQVVEAWMMMSRAAEDGHLRTEQMDILERRLALCDNLALCPASERRQLLPSLFHFHCNNHLEFQDPRRALDLAVDLHAYASVFGDLTGTNHTPKLLNCLNRADRVVASKAMKVVQGRSRALEMIQVREKLGWEWLSLGQRVSCVLCEEILQHDPTMTAAIMTIVGCAGTTLGWDGYHRLIADAERAFLAYDRALTVTTPHLNPYATLYLPVEPQMRVRVAQVTAASIEKSVQTSFGVDALSAAGFQRRLQRWRDGTAGRLRVGFISSDLGMTVTTYLCRDHFRHFDGSRVETFVYFTADNPGPWRDDIIRAVDHHRDLYEYEDGKEAVMAAVLRRDNLDILVNMDGYTRGTLRRDVINAVRHAPVQVSWFVYIGTLGSSSYDYIITDPVATPPRLASHFTEKFLHLPGSFFPNSVASHYPLPDRTAPGVPTQQRAEYDLPEDAFVFASFSRSLKLEPHVFTAWLRILLRVPDSVLWLLQDDHRPQNQLLQYAATAGLADRVIFAPSIASPDVHFARVSLADVVLDTLVFGGHTNSVDALWSGLPLVTCAGRCVAPVRKYETMGSRVAASLLSAMDPTLAGDLVVESLSEYEDVAVRLALDQPFYQNVRQRVLSSLETSTSFDIADYTRRFQDALFRAWDRYVQGLAPDHIPPPSPEVS